MQESFVLVLFGATGDLSSMKILPALYELKKRGLLPQQFVLIGNGRKPYTDESFRAYVISVLKNKYRDKFDAKLARSLVKSFHYLPGDLTDEALYHQIFAFFEELEKAGFDCQNRIFQLAILPQLYETVIEHLGEYHKKYKPVCGWIRIMVEKPFGYDLESAQDLDRKIKRYFHESQIYRIDHYMAKETVQNILAFRFANELFEPTLNSKFVDHIQITMFEKFGVKNRGRFYDRTGTVRDVLQNHLLQLLSTMTTNKPEQIDQESIRLNRQKLLSSLVKPNRVHLSKYAVSGQYSGYRDEADVDPKSRTETFVAVKAVINNNRWRRVPVYIRAGKNLAATVTEINVVYKDNSMHPSPNVLTFRIQPDESIVLRFFVTKPGPSSELQPANLEFSYKQLGETLMEAYARVVLDVFRGDQTLFTKASGVEAEWQFVDPILQYWKENKIKPETYQPGSWGPKSARRLIEQDGRAWIEPSTDVKMDN